MYNTCNSNYTDKYQKNFAEIFQKRQDKKLKTKEFFDLIAGEDNYIDVKEMGAHLGAVSRIFDGNTKSTPEDITFFEWNAAQNITDNADVRRNYDFWKNRLNDKFQENLDNN